MLMMFITAAVKLVVKNNTYFVIYISFDRHVPLGTYITTDALHSLIQQNTLHLLFHVSSCGEHESQTTTYTSSLTIFHAIVMMFFTFI